VASYKSSKFLILLGSSNEDGDGDDDDDPNVGMFLLMNTGNLCTRVCGSSAYIIGPSVSTINTSISSSMIKSILIHLTFFGSLIHCQVLSFSKITSLLIITFFMMGLYNLYLILLSPYPIKMHFSLLSLSLVLLVSRIFV